MMSSVIIKAQTRAKCAKHFTNVTLPVVRRQQHTLLLLIA